MAVDCLAQGMGARLVLEHHIPSKAAAAMTLAPSNENTPGQTLLLRGPE
jgi:hypothetical protein